MNDVHYAFNTRIVAKRTFASCTTALSRLNTQRQMENNHVEAVECPGTSPGILLQTIYATSSIITMISTDPIRSVGVRTTPIHNTLSTVAEIGSAVDSSAVLSEPISATPCM